MTVIHLNGEGVSPEPAKPKVAKPGSMRRWVTATYVAGLATAMLLGEAVGWLMPWLGGAGRGMSFLASLFCAALATIAYVAGFRYLVDYHNA
jgi:hypothetical protein